ncbi:MAG: FtsW/RodA/SpoVE family cell cycle protein [Oscillospiraceae bacterium]|jgi:cell division protein FtsW (lipid II flippase)|nr:FtsW/RodA/SpoVE family cell cycle protein [Oscillospiraceae bacterium]
MGGIGLGSADGILSYITLVLRYVLPIPALLVVARCAVSLLCGKHGDATWGYLSLPNGARVPLRHWENIIGRARDADCHMSYPSLSRSHAAVIRDSAGAWRVYDLGSKGGVRVNGESVAPGPGHDIKSGGLIDLGSVQLVFVSSDDELPPLAGDAPPPRNWAGKIKPGATAALLTEFQLMLGIQACIAKADALTAAVPFAFASLIAIMWFCYAMTRAMGRQGFEIETLAFFLCSVGLSAAASSAPEALLRQTGFLAFGVFLFFAVGWFLRDLNRAVRLRWPIGALGAVMLAINLALGTTAFGAKNWLQIGGVSFQPSEFVKIAFVFAGAATLDRLFAKRNLLLFIAYAGACVTALAAMRDFGSALVFFSAFLIIAFIRSGDAATVFLSVGAAAFAGVLAASARSHIAARFGSWGHAWENTDAAGGFQQTRAMAAAASGGLFGVGSGNGWLWRVFAADTDLVFAMTCEELGLVIAIASVLAITAISAFAVRAAASARSSFYVIGACAAASILLFQSALNVLGSNDLLPFTGVTLPFISRGGSSLISCWGLLAFIKASDTRPGASFAAVRGGWQNGEPKSFGGGTSDDTY